MLQLIKNLVSITKSQEKYVDDSIGEGTINRFNQTQKNYLKVPVGNDVYNLTEYDGRQITDTTIIKTGNTGSYLLPFWKNIDNDKNNNGKITSFMKSTKTNSPTNQSGAMILPPIGDSFCIKRHLLIIVERMFLVVSDELQLFSMVVSHSILTDFHI